MRHIFISAGHGGTDPGATGFGRTEAQTVLEFRDIVAHYLVEAGVRFSMDGVKGQNLPLRDSIRYIRPGDIAVEFHLNAAASPTATGVETLSADKHRLFGAKLCEAIASTLKIRNRGAKSESSGQHTKLAFVQAGGVIVELFFISNKDDLQAYDSQRWLLAKVVAAVLVAEAAK